MEGSKKKGDHRSPTCGDFGGKKRNGERRGEPCGNTAGKKTDHVGQGRCYLHGGAMPIKHGRYSKIARARLGDIMDEIEADPDKLNLVPELDLLRGILAKWMRDAGQAGALPPPMIAELTAKVTQIVDTIHKHKKGGPLTMETLHRIVEQMGLCVSRVLSKHVKDAELRELLSSSIEREWDSLAVS